MLLVRERRMGSGVACLSIGSAMRRLTISRYSLRSCSIFLSVRARFDFLALKVRELGRLSWPYLAPCET